MKKFTNKRLFLLVQLCLLTIATNAQYHLEWDEHQYLGIPDPPNNGYIAHATWNVNNNNLTFQEADEAGAIIYPNHYFEGTAIVTCNYRYEYYRNGRPQTATSSVSYSISFKSAEAVLDKTELSMSIGQSETIKGSFPGLKSMHGSPKMTWESSDDNIVTVSGSGSIANPTGKIKAVGSGEAYVTLDPIIGPPVSCIVNVEYISPRKAELTPNPLNVTVNKTKSLKISFSPEGASAKNITWESSNTNIATVSTSGLVKGIAEGRATITATTDNGVTATAEVIILPPPTSVSLPSTLTIPIGYSKTIVPTVYPAESETTFRWSSSDTSVATVSSGTIKGKTKGHATITVTTENGKTAECEVRIEPTPTELDYRNASNRSSAIESLVKRSLKNK